MFSAYMSTTPLRVQECEQGHKRSGRFSCYPYKSKYEEKVLRIVPYGGLVKDIMA